MTKRRRPSMGSRDRLKMTADEVDLKYSRWCFHYLGSPGVSNAIKTASRRRYRRVTRQQIHTNPTEF